MLTYQLRPHHGLCLQYFCGHGYNQKFINNMQKILETLGRNPNIQLVDFTDDICLTCPNCVNEIHNLTEITNPNQIHRSNLTNKKQCMFHKKVLHYDNCVMELCNLTYDSIIPWNEFNKLIHDNILSHNLRPAICGDCEWSHFCHKCSN